MKKSYQNPYIKLKPKTRSPYTVIYLVRHGNPDYSTEKVVGDFNMPLSSVGLKQRQYLTRRMLKMDIDKLYASQLLRAQETARPLATKLGKKLIIDERLDEINWQDWYRIQYFNTSERNRIKKFKQYLKLDKQLDAMQVEARHLLADIFRHNRGKRVACFCHGNIIKAILTSVIHSDIIGFLSLEIYQSSISKLVIDGDGYIKVGYINNVSHLPHEPNEDLFITLVD